MDELRHAIRRIARHRGGSLASIVTLAAAIGAMAATWSLIASTLLHPLPVREPDRLVVAGTRARGGPFAGRLFEGLLYPEFARLRDSGAFEAVAAEWSQAPLLLTSGGGSPVNAKVGFATANYLDLLGVDLWLGRGFQPAEDRRGAAPVAILTEAYCRREFDGCVNAIGRILTVAGRAVPVVGVAARGFHGLDLSQSIDFYLPFHTIGDVASPFMNYFADAGTGTSPTAGTRIVARLRQGDHRRIVGDVELTPIERSAIPVLARPAMSQFARMLGATVALLLLIGCGTVGMLLLVRSESRRGEFALCVALGASRMRLAGGIVAEGALLSGAGALLGVPCAWWLFSAAGTFALPGGIPIGRLDLHLDAGAIAVTTAAALVACGIVALIAGAIGLASGAPEALRSRAGATPRIRRRATRAVLVAGQVAISLVLVAGAGLFARSLAEALSLNDGLDMATVITGGVSLDRNVYGASRAGQFFDTVRARLNGNPFIASIAYGVERGGMLGRMVVDGESRQFASQVRFSAVDPDYFHTLGVRLLDGRGFTAADRNGAPPVAIVSESFARRLGGGGSALGRRITMPFHMADRPPDVMTVVGVVSDVVDTVSELEPLRMYLPLAQVDGGTSRAVVARAAGNVDAARHAILAAIKETDSALIAPALPTLADRIDAQMFVQKFGAAIFGSLGTLAVLLTMLGSYVLAESMAVMRRREMGIRAALGATRRQLAVIVLAETGRLVGAGVTVGLVLAWTGAATVRSFLFHVRPLDPATLVAAAISILALAAAVSLRPAIQAGRVDLGELLKEL